MRPVSILYLLVMLFFNVGCGNSGSKVRKMKDGFILEGNFIDDSIPNGVIKFYNFNGKLHSIKKYERGVLNGESLIYFDNGSIYNMVTFENGKEIGYRQVYDTLSNLIYKSNFYYGREIGHVFSYDSANNVLEYSFNNFEDEILYYCSYDTEKKRYVYPSNDHLIVANTSEATASGQHGINVFVYLFKPPKLRLNYSIVYLDKADSIVDAFPISSKSFFYINFFEKKSDSLKLAVMLNRYDTLSMNEEIIIKYLKMSYP